MWVVAYKLMYECAQLVMWICVLMYCIHIDLYEYLCSYAYMCMHVSVYACLCVLMRLCMQVSLYPCTHVAR